MAKKRTLSDDYKIITNIAARDAPTGAQGIAVYAGTFKICTRKNINKNAMYIFYLLF